MEPLKRAVKRRLHDDFGIGHSTLEFEFVPCDAQPVDDCFQLPTSTAAHTPP